MKRLRFLLFIMGVLFASNGFSQNVYATKTGKKYHKRSCHYLKSSVRELTLDKAIELGFSPCSVCKPKAEKNNSSVSTSSSLASDEPTKAEPKKSASTQCTGKTKAGTRCKRMTTNSNRRCYQHQS